MELKIDDLDLSILVLMNNNKRKKYTAYHLAKEFYPELTTRELADKSTMIRTRLVKMFEKTYLKREEKDKVWHYSINNGNVEFLKRLEFIFRKESIIIENVCILHSDTKYNLVQL